MAMTLSRDIAGVYDSDAELAVAAAADDKQAFAAIYDRYADRLYDFCVGMLADRDGAADCVQDTFCKAAARLPQLRDPAKLRPWLYSIARNEALRRITERRRETPADELPDAASGEDGPDTLAARTELADLIADAAGGLSDRDRSVLELAFRHGLDSRELAEALGVSPANANTIVHRLRDTIERSLGALLVARRVRNNGCAELASILDSWDGHFNVLMRKRVSRHIESCATCDEERRRLVSPVALLGAAPVIIPAPTWLRERTLHDVRLTSASRDVARTNRNSRGSLLPITMFVVAMLAALGLSFAWLDMQKTAIPAPIEVSEMAPPAPPAPPPPVPLPVIPPPPSADVKPDAPSAVSHTAAPAPTVEQPSAQPPTAVPPLIAEPPPPSPTAVPPPPAMPPPLVMPPPVIPPLPPLQWPDLTQWPQWPGTPPGSAVP